jgi:hypothetical protein
VKKELNRRGAENAEIKVIKKMDLFIKFLTPILGLPFIGLFLFKLFQNYIPSKNDHETYLQIKTHIDDFYDHFQKRDMGGAFQDKKYNNLFDLLYLLEKVNFNCSRLNKKKKSIQKNLSTVIEIMTTHCSPIGLTEHSKIHPERDYNFKAKYINDLNQKMDSFYRCLDCFLIDAHRHFDAPL